jgi:hypothetical protein
VNENYDEGIIAQQRVALAAVDTFATVAERIHELEQAFEVIIERILIKVYNKWERRYIYTDGAAGNPGNGGYGVVMGRKSRIKEEFLRGLGELRIIEWNYWL